MKISTRFFPALLLILCPKIVLADLLIFNQSIERTEGLTACTLTISPEIDGKIIHQIILGYGSKPYRIKTDKTIIIRKAMAVCYDVNPFTYEFTKPIIAKNGTAIGFLGHKESKVITYTKGGF
ncbi:MAG: hypothetical protein K0S11_379 [Gammaproteobacteria bacterium]|jgi:hypothetical protein|nr:hypothetical protein [Gammaproteobacteria bacterium]